MKYWRQLLGPAMVSPHSYCVTKISHERWVEVWPKAKVALWQTALASMTTEERIWRHSKKVKIVKRSQ